MKKRFFSMVLAVVMVLSMLTGCSSKSTNAPAETKEGEKKTTTKAEKSDTYNSQAIESSDKITITMMVSGTATEHDLYTEVMPKLVSKKWPNVKLEVTELPDDNYYTSLKTKLASGQCPDIILVQPKYAGTNACYTLAKSGYLASLNDMKCLSNMKNLTENMTLDGTTYAIPNGVSILGTYYNKKMFDQYKLKEPTTWKDFLNVCKTLKDNGVQPIVMGDKDSYVLQFGLYQLACNEIYAKNDKYDDQLYTDKAKFTDKGTWDKVISMYKELYDKKYIDASVSLGLSSSQAIQKFIDGEAAMTFDGSFNAKAIKAKGKVEFDRGYFPLPGECADGKVYTAVCTSAGPAIYAKSKYIDQCKEILDWCYDGKSELWDAYVASGKYAVTYGNGSEKLDPLFKPFLDSLNKGQAFYWCNQAWPSGVADKMEEVFYEMVGGQGKTLNNVTEEMQSSFEDLQEE
ncbi:extracellular solute-binding protein, family 1 [Lachnospiraceae bacterium KM106-2]|nr:extracellular solute-binding protein, family 1 [Lachnospiraceae bacterium KM106-2]